MPIQVEAHRGERSLIQEYFTDRTWLGAGAPPSATREPDDAVVLDVAWGVWWHLMPNNRSHGVRPSAPNLKERMRGGHITTSRGSDATPGDLCRNRQTSAQASE